MDSLHISSQMAYIRIRGLMGYFHDASVSHGVPVALLLAIASRESNMGLALDANFAGDNGNGIGIMQIDRRYHSGFTNRHAGSDHQANINYGAEFLSGLIRQFPGDRQAAVAAYNAGASRVRSARAAGLPPDAVTTGRDYSTDVIKRMKTIESIAGRSKTYSLTTAVIATAIAAFVSYTLLTQNN